MGKFDFIILAKEISEKSDDRFSLPIFLVYPYSAILWYRQGKKT